MKTVLIVMLVMALLGGGGYAIYASIKKDDKKPPGNKDTPDPTPKSTPAPNPAPPAPPFAAAINNYSTEQLENMVPASIAGSTNALSSEQWGNITVAANALPAAKFQALQTQLQGINWMEVIAVNALSTDALYNAIMQKLQP